MSGSGAAPFGSLWNTLTASSTLWLTDVEAFSERTLHVTFSAAPQDVSPILAGDVRNPASWRVINEETGQDLNVLAVVKVDSVTYALYCLKKFGPYAAQHRVYAEVLDTLGFVITDPRELPFAGCVKATPQETAVGTIDIANPYFSGEQVGGTLIVGSDGDYDNDAGIELLRKLIYRRLTTMPGGFTYLGTSYGLGLKVKEPLLVGDLEALQAQIERQVAQEPEVSAVSARLVLRPGDNVLFIQLSVTLRKTNQQVPLSIPISLAGNE